MQGFGRGAGLAGVLVFLSAGAYAQSTLRIAVIGDYGVDNSNELAVATRVLASAPDLITTVGDNNYFLGGGFSDWDRTQGKYYAPYIKLPASSAYLASGSPVNKFFPVLGNHDWDAIGSNWNGGNNSYANYFELPGNERYYTFQQGDVAFFMLDSDSREPDGVSSLSVQAAWLQSAMASSTARWKIVQFHEPAQTSIGQHPPNLSMRWDFKAMGASAVLQGHNHFYERLNVNGLPYFVNGSGGNSFHTINLVDSNSQFRDNSHRGFLQIDASASALVFQFIDTGGTVRDSYTIALLPEPPSLALAGCGAGSASSLWLWRRFRKRKDDTWRGSTGA